MKRAMAEWRTRADEPHARPRAAANAEWAGLTGSGPAGIGPVSRDVLDPLRRFDLALEDTINVKASRIVVIGGHLDEPRLREALRRTVRPVASCASGVTADGTRLRRGSWAPEDVPCAHRLFPGTISLESDAFRRGLIHDDRRVAVGAMRVPAGRCVCGVRTLGGNADGV